MAPDDRQSLRQRQGHAAIKFERMLISLVYSMFSKDSISTTVKTDCASWNLNLRRGWVSGDQRPTDSQGPWMAKVIPGV